MTMASVLQSAGSRSNWASHLINRSLSKSRQLQTIQKCCLHKISYHNQILKHVNFNYAIPNCLKQQIIWRRRPSLHKSRLLGSGDCLPNITTYLQYTTCSNIFQNRNDSSSYGSTGPGRAESSDSKDALSKTNGRKLLNEQKETFRTMLDEAQSTHGRDSFDFGDDVAQQRDTGNREEQRTKIKIDPSNMSVLLFPGQGAQFVGMGKKLLEYPIVKEMYEVASTILGYDLLALCLNGPKNDLDRTVYCQPAVLVTSLAAVEKLKEENIKAVENCVATAGFSVGEYAALVFGGALSFEDAVYLIKVRAEAMQHASDMVPSGMISVTGGRGTKYREICAEATRHCQVTLNMEKPVCKVANYLFPNARVLAGNKEALEFIIEMKDKFHIRNFKHIPVSGAFHTPLMAPAEEALANALDKINIEQPLIKIHSNIDGKAYTKEQQVRKQLRRQVVEPVLWEQTLMEIYQREKGENFPLTYEVGPGKQLGLMLQRFNKKAFRNYHKVEV